MTFTNIAKPNATPSPKINAVDILINLIDDTIDGYTQGLYSDIEKPPISGRFYPLFSAERYPFSEDYYPFTEDNYTDEYYNEIIKPS